MPVLLGNNGEGKPKSTNLYALNSGETDETLAQMDSNIITARRTAVASALASSYLSRSDSDSLLMIGAGRMGRYLVPAHISVRPIVTIWIWDRNPFAASQFANDLREQGYNAQAIRENDLPNIVSQAAIISCATLATEPVLKGEWLSLGTHVDLVGSLTPSMREADSQVIQKANVFVDTRDGVLAQTGDLIIPIQEGVFLAESIEAELIELCSKQHKGRQDLMDAKHAITVFKSVGDSRDDIAAAILAFEAVN